MRKNVTRSSYYRTRNLLGYLVRLAQTVDELGLFFSSQLKEENDCIDGWVYTYAFEYNGTYRVYTLMCWYNPNIGGYQFTINNESQGIS